MPETKSQIREVRRVLRLFGRYAAADVLRATHHGVTAMPHGWQTGEPATKAALVACCCHGCRKSYAVIDRLIAADRDSDAFAARQPGRFSHA